MKTSVATLYLFAGVSVLGAAFLACGGSTVTQASSSAAGTGGATSSSSKTVTTGTNTTVSSTGSDTTTNTVSSTGSGGGSNCDVACQKAIMCGFDVCKQAGVDCNNLTPQQKCLTDCAADPMVNCNNIFNCYQQCMGMGAGGGNPGDGGQTCQQCAVGGIGGGGKCTQEAQACATDNPMAMDSCANWLQCVAQCQDSACATACDMQYSMNANTVKEYKALYACTCANCKTECMATDPCSHM